MRQELAIGFGHGIPVYSVHVQVVEAFLFLFVYMVEHIVTFGCEIHFHVGLIADGLQTFRISTHFLHRVTA